jgi:hypothetical protein
MNSVKLTNALLITLIVFNILLIWGISRKASHHYHNQHTYCWHNFHRSGSIRSFGTCLYGFGARCGCNGGIHRGFVNHYYHKNY